MSSKKTFCFAFIFLLAVLLHAPSAGIFAAPPAVQPNPPAVGSPITFTADTAGGVGLITYQWYSGSSPNCAFDGAIAGAIGNSYSTTLQANIYYCYTARDSLGSTATSPTYPPTYITQFGLFQSWLPVMFLAMTLSFMVVAVYYMFGVLFDNRRIKARAVGEFTQAVGTGVLLIIIVAVLMLIGSTQFSWISWLSTTSLQTLCTQLTSSQLSLLQVDALTQSQLQSGTPLSGGQIPPSAITTICAQSQQASSLTDITDRINYGLYSTYIILANLTNQAANNLNSFYVFEGWIGFLSNFQEIIQICTPNTCNIPITPRLTNLKISMQPLEGYSSLTSITTPLESEAGLTFYILYLQLTIITMMLFAWPYVLGAGIVLRATFFTRKLGGLLMAVALMSVIIYPLMYLLEYTAFTNLQLGPIGASNLPSIPLYQKQTSGMITVYGAPSTQAGYVPASGVVGSGCAVGQYVWENTCGASSSAVVGKCLSTPLPLGTQVCAGGYVSPSVAPKAACVTGFGTAYAYESQCGNPDTAGGCLYGAASNPQPCPSSGYVPVTDTNLVGTFTCAADEYVQLTDCNVPSTAVPATCTYTVPLDPNTNKPQLCTTQLQSNVNFFVMPRADRVLSYYNCNANDAIGGLLGAEIGFSLPYLTPFVAIFQIFSAFGSLASAPPPTPADIGGCNPPNAIKGVFALTNLYGIVFVSSIFTLLINVIAALAGLTGLANLFGGDTSILGLSNLV